MKLALYQMKMEQDMEQNWRRSMEGLIRAADNYADLILFPEIQLYPFFPQYEKRDVSGFEMEISHPFVQEMCRLCAEKQIMAAPNIYLSENGKRYDATLLIDKQGRIICIQKMVHIAQAKQFYEQDYYHPSDTGFHVVNTEFGRIGIVICFDRHYTESVRTEALMGADLILIPTANVKSEPLQMFEWEIRVQAFQNSVAVAMCNRTGKEDEMDFAGESIVVLCDGDVVAKASDQEELLFAECNIRKSAENRKQRPYTNLRNTKWYL